MEPILKVQDLHTEITTNYGRRKRWMIYIRIATDEHEIEFCPSARFHICAFCN